MQPNALYYGDCLDWMERWDDASVDLVYLDPPFNSESDYNMLYSNSGGGAQYRAFVDTWRWDVRAAERLATYRSAIARPAHASICGLDTILGPSGMLAYLLYMAERLEACARLLKPTGSIYLHCDDAAVHYLKVLMDGIFQHRYRNDLAWRRATAHNDPRRFGRIVDHVLYYARGERPYWNASAGRTPRAAKELARAYPSQDARGRFRSADLTGPSHGRGMGSPSMRPWRDYDVAARGRCWAVPKTGAYAGYIEREFLPEYRQLPSIHERLDALDAADLIHHPTRGVWPGLKRYAAADQGTPPQSLILSPTGFTNYNTGRGEFLGYPTQKPAALLEHLIAVASPADGLILDPFCGCGTTIAAAHKLKRPWVGIDISSFAIDVIRKRMDGVNIPAYGIPQDVRSATKLAAERPFEFETWAVTRLNGFVPNTKQVADGGVDGRGTVWEQPDGDLTRLALAQVKGGAFSLGNLRDFNHVIDRDRAALGCYLTLDRVDTHDARMETAGMGTINVSGMAYPRMQRWSMADYFDRLPPVLPLMADPYTGKPMQMRLV